MLTVSIHPVDDAHREIAVQLTTFIPSPLFHEVLDSDYGLLVDLPEEGFQSLPLVFKHSSLSQSRRLLKTTLHAKLHRSCSASAFPPPPLLASSTAD